MRTSDWSLSMHGTLNVNRRTAEVTGEHRRRLSAYSCLLLAPAALAHCGQVHCGRSVFSKAGIWPVGPMAKGASFPALVIFMITFGLHAFDTSLIPIILMRPWDRYAPIKRTGHRLIVENLAHGVSWQVRTLRLAAPYSKPKTERTATALTLLFCRGLLSNALVPLHVTNHGII